MGAVLTDVKNVADSVYISMLRDVPIRQAHATDSKTLGGHSTRA